MLIDASQVPSLTANGRLRTALDTAEHALPESSTQAVSSGLCDLQINGFAGVDFNNPTMSLAAFERALEAMLATGVSCCLPTIISASEDWQTRCFQALKAGCQQSELARQMVAGYHLEGPFLSPEPGFRGCHPEAAMVPARWDHFQRLQDAAGGRIRLITVAPEVDGVLELIPRWVAAGVTVAIGHSAASRAVVQQAVEAGARLSTHLGNGVAPLLPKGDNIILSQLGDDRLSASFIADGFHIPRHVLQVYLRAKQSARTLLVTDGTAGSAAPPGRYSLGKVALERQQKAVVYIPESNSLAGSATTLSDCVRHVTQWYDIPLAEAVNWASEHPRRLIGLSALPQVGESAEWVWWQKQDNGWQVQKVQLGEQIYRPGGFE